MANQITDGRTLVNSLNATTTTVTLAGGGAGTLDTEILIQGTGSVGFSISNTLAGILHNAGAAQNWSNNVFYIWINCGIVGLLATKAAGGFRIRFAGATVTNWFEVRVAGSDEWPASVAGGWTQFVVDIETARATAITNGWTNGTVPATSAIQYVGYAAVTGGTMPRMVDNTWIDEIRRLPDGSPGIIVEGRNGGTTPWNSANIATQLGIATGTFVLTAGGAYKINTPIRFGINDTTFHAFSETNAVWLWDDQEFLPDDVYSISALGNAGGTTNVTFGIKSGVGNDATGAQGLIISAVSDGARWSMDFDDPNLNSIGMYGCLFQHINDIQMDLAAVEFISTTLIDGSSLTLGPGLLQRCSIVDANTADGVAYVLASDPGRIRFSDFTFSDGHAIQITSAAGSPFSFLGNTFSGYGANASTDAAILIDNLTATLDISAGGNTPTKREINGGSLTINNNISVTLTGMRDGTEVRVLDNITGEFLAGVESVVDGSIDNRSFTFSLSASTIVDIAIFNINFILPPNNRIENFQVPTSDASIPISQVRDRNYNNP